MPKLVTEFPGGCLLAFADFPAIDHHIPLVGAAVNSEGTERKIIKVHVHLLVQLRSGAFFGVRGFCRFNSSSGIHTSHGLKVNYGWILSP
jgi:hypothetical protein